MSIYQNKIDHCSRHHVAACRGHLFEQSCSWAMTSLQTGSHVDMTEDNDRLRFMFRPPLPTEQTLILLWTMMYYDIHILTGTTLSKQAKICAINKLSTFHTEATGSYYEIVNFKLTLSQIKGCAGSFFKTKKYQIYFGLSVIFTCS